MGNKGYTIIDILVVVMAVATLLLAIALTYAGIHFVGKWW